MDVDEISIESKKEGNSSIFIWALLLLVVGGALFRRFKLSEV